eukprot:jgi/Botrbrau1/18260/Bobra.0562s0002.1
MAGEFARAQKYVYVLTPVVGQPPPPPPDSPFASPSFVHDMLRSTWAHARTTAHFQAVLRKSATTTSWDARWTPQGKSRPNALLYAAGRKGSPRPHRPRARHHSLTFPQSWRSRHPHLRPMPRARPPAEDVFGPLRNQRAKSVSRGCRVLLGTKPVRSPRTTTVQRGVQWSPQSTPLLPPASIPAPSARPPAPPSPSPSPPPVPPSPPSPPSPPESPSPPPPSPSPPLRNPRRPLTALLPRRFLRPRHQKHPHLHPRPPPPDASPPPPPTTPVDPDHTL